MRTRRQQIDRKTAFDRNLTATQLINQPRAFMVQAAVEETANLSPEQADLQTQLLQAQDSGYNFAQLQVQPTTSRIIQPKLTIGSPNDKYEQEADSVAQKVVERINSPASNLAQKQTIQRQENPEEEVQAKPLADAIQREEMPEDEEVQAKPLADAIQREEMPEDEEVQAKPLADAIQREEMPEDEEVQAKPLADAIQREEMPEDEEVQAKPLADAIQREEMPEDEEVQAKPLADAIQREEMPEDEEVQAKTAEQPQSRQGGMQAPANVESSIEQARGSGKPLDGFIKRPMEQAFGTDFSGVRIHTDSRSDQLNRSINAQAFTTKNNIFFKQGSYNPKTQQGQQLLAHELTHVVQQTGTVQHQVDQQIMNRKPISVAPKGMIQAFLSEAQLKEKYDQTTTSTDLFASEFEEVTPAPREWVNWLKEYFLAIVTSYQKWQHNKNTLLALKLTNEETRFPLLMKYIDKQKRLLNSVIYGDTILEDLKYEHTLNNIKVQIQETYMKEPQAGTWYIGMSLIRFIDNVITYAAIEKNKVMDEEMELKENYELLAGKKDLTKDEFDQEQEISGYEVLIDDDDDGNYDDVNVTEKSTDKPKKTSIKDMLKKVKSMFQSKNSKEREEIRKNFKSRKKDIDEIGSSTVKLKDVLQEGDQALNKENEEALSKEKENDEKLAKILGEDAGFWGLIRKIGEITAGVVSAGVSIYAWWERYKEMKTLETKLNTTNDQGLQEVFAYSYAKVRRSVWEGFGDLIAKIAKTVCRIITILSGGATTVVTEVIRLSINIAQAIKRLVQAVKGIYKWLIGTRGENREIAAENIVAYAASGNEDAIEVIHKFKPFNFLDKDTLSKVKSKARGLLKTLNKKKPLQNNDFLDLRDLDLETLKEILPDILNDKSDYKQKMADELKSKFTSKSTI